MTLAFALRLPTVRLSPSVFVALLGVLMPRSASAQEAAIATYVRSDSDHTTVITPRMRVAVPVADTTTLDAAYTVDVWTSASVDMRAVSPGPIDAVSSASRVTERRDEVDLGLTHVLGDLTLTGGYRYSTEPDYKSHGGGVGFILDMAQKASTLSLNLGGTSDTVGRSGDPQFKRPTRNLNARLGFTQVLDEDTLVQVIYELSNAHGYLASPYRFVGIGGYDGTCRDYVGFSVGRCIPEALPKDRLRHAAALRLRRALGTALSAGATYRFYFDDWALMSHTVDANVALSPGVDTVFSLSYRFYTQGAAEHYKVRYSEAVEGGFYTRDKELSPFVSHRIMLDAEHRFELNAEGGALRLMAAAGPTFYAYSDFVPLASVTAVEATVAVGLEL